MNPWGSEAPMMTFAVQAYQHQWLLQVGLILLSKDKSDKPEILA